MKDQKILETATHAHAEMTPRWRRAWDAWGAELLVGALLAAMVMAAIALYPVVLV